MSQPLFKTIDIVNYQPIREVFIESQHILLEDNWLLMEVLDLQHAWHNWCQAVFELEDEFDQKTAIEMIGEIYRCQNIFMNAFIRN